MYLPTHVYNVLLCKFGAYALQPHEVKLDWDSFEEAK
jgi:hypothetical protein